MNRDRRYFRRRFARRRKRVLSRRRPGVKRLLSVSAAVGLVFVGLVLWQVIDATTHRIIRIESVKVPKSYEDAGFTPEVIRDRIMDQIDSIDGDLDRVDGGRQRTRNATTVRSSDSEVHEIDIEVAGAKIDFRRVAEWISELLGKAPAEIKGEITLDSVVGSVTASRRTSLSIRIHDKKKPQVIKIRPRDDDPNTVVQAFAETILKELDPYPLAAHDYYVSALVTGQESGRYGVNPSIEARELLSSIIDNAANKSKAVLLSRAHNVLGFTYLDFAGMQDLSRAESEFRASLQRDPHFYLPEYGLARVLNAEGDREEAKGNKAVARQKFTDALGYYDAMIRYDESWLLAYYTYAAVELRLGDPKSAINKCEAAIKYADGDMLEGAELFSVLGNSELGAGDLNAARAAFERSISYWRKGSEKYYNKRDEWPPAYAGLGNLHFVEARNTQGPSGLRTAVGYYCKAFEINAKVLSSDDTSSYTYRNWAEALDVLRRPAEADAVRHQVGEKIRSSCVSFRGVNLEEAADPNEPAQTWGDVAKGR